jgi:hypothetical protein
MQETNASCQGLCRPGYYCPPGSIISTQFICDNTATYCPIGSPVPTPVSVGYYTVSHVGNNGSLHADIIVDGNIMTTHERSAQTICQPGQYCDKDGEFQVDILNIVVGFSLIYIYLGNAIRYQAYVPSWSIWFHFRVVNKLV